MRNIIATTVAWLVLKQALACSDNAADNYSPGTGRICAYPPVFYCSNPSADNYQAQLASSSARVRARMLPCSSLQQSCVCEQLKRCTAVK